MCGAACGLLVSTGLPLRAVDVPRFSCQSPPVCLGYFQFGGTNLHVSPSSVHAQTLPQDGGSQTGQQNQGTGACLKADAHIPQILGQQLWAQSRDPHFQTGRSPGVTRHHTAFRLSTRGRQGRRRTHPDLRDALSNLLLLQPNQHHRYASQQPAR